MRGRAITAERLELGVFVKLDHDPDGGHRAAAVNTQREPSLCFVIPGSGERWAERKRERREGKKERNAERKTGRKRVRKKQRGAWS